jgi:hypothetical protein
MTLEMILTANAVNDNVATALFVFLEDYPFAFYLNIIAIILIAGSLLPFRFRIFSSR